MQSRWIRLCSSQTTLRYCKNVSILASEAQAAADEVDAVAIDEMVDQIIHDDLSGMTAALHQMLSRSAPTTTLTMLT